MAGLQFLNFVAAAFELSKVQKFQLEGCYKDICGLHDFTFIRKWCPKEDYSRLDTSSFALRMLSPRLPMFSGRFPR